MDWLFDPLPSLSTPSLYSCMSLPVIYNLFWGGASPLFLPLIPRLFLLLLPASFGASPFLLVGVVAELPPVIVSVVGLVGRLAVAGLCVVVLPRLFFLPGLSNGPPAGFVPAGAWLSD